ncbi:MAG: hypothetical protein HN627_11680, partial [Opitutae bacterium]|nr:hypothetical protein [Opitutae bacterium]
MRLTLYLLIALTGSFGLPALQAVPPARDAIRIVQLLRSDNVLRRYPDALPSLLRHMNKETTARFDTDPLFIQSLEDEQLLQNPIL